VSDDVDRDDAYRAARRGDAAALDALIRRHHDRLLRLAQARLSGPLRARMRASDLLQSTYLEVVRRFDTFRGDDDPSFLAWATVIMDHALTDRARFHGAQKRDVAAETPLGDDVDARRPSPRTGAAAAEDLELAAQAAAKLPADYREVLDLCVGRGLSRRDAAATMNRSEGAVRVLLCRARAALVMEIDRLRSGRA